MKSKICVWCGKEFVPNSPRQNSCGEDHYRPCADCGTPLLIKESYQNYMKYGPRRCPECRKKAISATRRGKSQEEKDKIKQKSIKTCLERYGTEWGMQSDCVKQRAKDSLRDRYGVENVSQLPETQEKIRKNSQDKYGVDHYSQDPTIRSCMQEGMVKKYGVRYAQQSAEIREKTKKTNLDKYGVSNVLESTEIQLKIKETCRAKYGVDYAAQAPEVIRKRTATNILKYGAPALIFSDEFLVSLIQDPTKKEEYLKFRSDPESWILNNFVEEKPTYSQISSKIGLSEGQISETLKHLGLQNLVKYNRSKMEEEVIECLRLMDSKLEIIRDSKSIISPMEIDIYLPKYRFGIECNPSFTHNSSLPAFGSNEIIPSSYHQVKSKLAYTKGIFLFHLFGYEWLAKRDILLSMIQNTLHLTPNRIYARNCRVVKVSSKFASDFLESYHRQGSVSCSVKLGLVDSQDNVVSLMTFNKMRPGVGKKDSDTKNTWELSRFCSVLNTNVVGGASKLLKYFIDMYDPDKLVSFSDIARAQGNLYKMLGFTQVSTSQPGYVWSTIDDKVYYNRMKCQKSNLKNLFNEPDIDIEHKTEREIMIEHGFVQVFDSGVIRWEREFKES